MVAVQFKHVDDRSVWVPGDIGEVASLLRPLQREGSLEISGLVSIQVVDTNGNDMAGHACHGVFVGLVGRFAREDIHLRIVCHHRLIHAVEGQALAVGTPEGSLVDAELVSVYGRTIHHIAAAIGA